MTHKNGGVTRRRLLRFAAAATAFGATATLFRGNAATTIRKIVRPYSASRAERACDIRVGAARTELARERTDARTNGDEARYPNYIGSFSKTLPHDERAEVNPAAYRAYVAAIESGDWNAIEAIPRGGGGVRLANPLAAHAFTLEGADPLRFAPPPPPAFASAAIAAEACELYWRAVTRDVPYHEFESNKLIAGAAADLSRLSAFEGPKENGGVTPATVFRGTMPGALVGPFISQYLLKEVPYGAIRVDQLVRVASPGFDYLTSWDDWIASQRAAPAPPRIPGPYRHIITGRDLAEYVHLDFAYQSFLTAALILFGMEGTTEASRPYRGAPFDQNNPYRHAKNQGSFATFGSAHALDLLARASNDAMIACWGAKWLLHRRVRPEMFGGRVHLHKSGKAEYPIHSQILDSPVLDIVHRQHGTYLLPQAYPEGCPTHPSYPAGHATSAGACATILKAFFDETFPVDDPVVATRDGLALSPYEGPALTVGGELDKLATNCTFARDTAGIHWRSDGTAGLALGEEIAIALLRDVKRTVVEPFEGWKLTKFDGTNVVV